MLNGYFAHWISGDVVDILYSWIVTEKSVVCSLFAEAWSFRIDGERELTLEIMKK